MNRVAWMLVAALFASAATAGLDSHATAAMGACKATARNAFQSCKLGAQSDTKLALGKCTNLPAAPEKKACSQTASMDGKDALKSCSEQNRLRQAVCARLGDAPYAPAIDPTKFTHSTMITNPFLPLPPGTTFISEGTTVDGFEHVEFAVTHATRVILGVTCVEVHDVRTVNGAVLEDTRDWFAQDDDGNVWYFGENTAIVDGGRALVDGGLPLDLSGTWTGGVDTARPGIVMKAHPAIGDFYRQEFFLGEAEDLAEVKSLSETVTLAPPLGTFTNCLKTEESSPLAPGDVESKLYDGTRGAGLLQTIEANGDVVKLVQIRTE